MIQPIYMNLFWLSICIKHKFIQNIIIRFGLIGEHTLYQSVICLRLAFRKATKMYICKKKKKEFKRLCLFKWSNLNTKTFPGTKIWRSSSWKASLSLKNIFGIIWSISVLSCTPSIFPLSLEPTRFFSSRSLLTLRNLYLPQWDPSCQPGWSPMKQKTPQLQAFGADKDRGVLLHIIPVSCQTP